RRIVVFLPNWIGVAVMATPTLRALRRRFGPDGEIVGIARAHVVELLRGSGLLDRTWLYAPERRDFLHRPRGLVWRLTRERADVSVHLTNDLMSACVARLGRVRVRAGYARNRRGWLLTHALAAPHDGRRYLPISALDAYLALAYALGCPEEAPRLELGTLGEDEEAAGAAWRTLGIHPDEPVVLLNSSGAYGAAKLWPDESFAALARRIVGELNHAVVVLCGPDERARAAAIAELAAHPRVRSLAALPLGIGLTKACMRRARCLVSTDSGPRHVAAAFGIPVVALFGPTDPAWSETYHPREVKLWHDVPCGPCAQRTCPHGHHACMRDLGVDTVLAAVARALSASRAA
ncbi:lipopolysaccharide heptosyltransferase II, partial [Candidatus Binatia bacterium]|nr:lipopolysaccharide heptosyltransferase II [Candidatus Binatia bacterium]